MGAVLSFDNVGFRRGTGPEALSNINFTLQRGEIAIVEGTAGAGKTSLLALAATAEPPGRGDLRLFDQDPTALNGDALAALRRRIGFVGETLPLIDTLSLGENVALPLRIAGTSAAERTERVQELLGWIGLAERADARPPLLTRSEHSWAGIARAIVARPELLLADEPLTMPSPEEARRLASLLRRLAELGSAILIATRDAGWTAPVAGARRWRLAKGRLGEVAPA